MEGTPSLLIASAARTDVPPRLARLGNRSANPRRVSEEAAKYSPPAPRFMCASNEMMRLRSLVTGTDKLSSRVANAVFGD